LLLFFLDRPTADDSGGRAPDVTANALLFLMGSTSAPAALCEHVLHIFPSFGIGGVPLRMVRVINHFGKRFRHTVIALDDDFAAAHGLASEPEVMLSSPRQQKAGTLRTVFGGALALRRLRPDLLITYNWGSIEWAMANRLVSVARHIHIEAGFGQREADSQIFRRVLFRRWALARCALIVVPSRLLEDLALGMWRLPADRVTYVPNGVDLARFSAPPRDIVPGFTRRTGELVIGTVAPLRPEKNVGRLLRIFAALNSSPPARLLIAGDGIERRLLEQLARDLGIADRVIFTGRVAPEDVLGTFDIFALSSDTEQMPNALLEAMAASRPVAAVNVGDVKSIVCEENRDFIVERDDGAAFAEAIAKLLRDPDKRRTLGFKNHERVVNAFSQERMFAAYSEIFAAGHTR
jgi:glycosyltransferase involved in cell wall biosynthesis